MIVYAEDAFADIFNFGGQCLKDCLGPKIPAADVDVDLGQLKGQVLEAYQVWVADGGDATSETMDELFKRLIGTWTDSPQAFDELKTLIELAGQTDAKKFQKTFLRVLVSSLV